MKKKILVIDDHEPILRLFERMLSKKKFDVHTSLTGNDAIQKLTEGNFDLIISDLNLTEINGLELLTQSQQLSRYTPFIVITGHGSVESAVRAVKTGAFDFLIKPFGKDQIMTIIERALNDAELRTKDKKSIPQDDKAEAFEGIIARSQKMQKLFNVIEQVASTSATVLIQGESGTGKELFSRSIHKLSERKKQTFVAVNCGALSENLLENELFGHVKGAFTGASNYKAGLFSVADKGTIFLDEIGDVTPAVQTKLLRVLQEKEFIPLGSNETVRVDVRVIAATNVDLKDAVKKKIFREDLYYRLAVIPLTIPPLRDRIEDIPILAIHFFEKYRQEYSKKIDSITAEAIEKLQSHNWPGNVRELENIIERAVALCSSSKITEDLIDQYLQDFAPMRDSNTSSSTLHGPITSRLPLKVILNRVTKEAIIKALRKTNGNRTKAAMLLGIGRASLYHKLKEYGIEGYSSED